MSWIPGARACAAAVLAAVAPLASAEEPLLKAGDKELEFAGSLTRSTTEAFGAEMDATILSLSFRGGHFVSDRTEVGLVGIVLRSDVDGVDAFTFGQAGPFVDLHFPSPGSRMVPVAGVAARVVFGDFSGNAIEASGGVRVFSSDDVSVNTRVFYEIQDLEDGGIDQETETLGVRIGFSWILR